MREWYRLVLHMAAMDLKKIAVFLQRLYCCTGDSKAPLAIRSRLAVLAQRECAAVVHGALPHFYLPGPQDNIEHAALGTCVVTRVQGRHGVRFVWSVQAASALTAAGRHEFQREGSCAACRHGAGGWGDGAKVSIVRHRSGGERSYSCSAVCVGACSVSQLVTTV